MPDDNGCANDVKQKSGDFRGGPGINRALAGVYEVRADEHCCKRQQLGATIQPPKTAATCANSSKQRNNWEGANAGDRSASTLALEPKQ